ncbi:MAG TPA: FAD-dependent monooxygenase [Solirubrobacteraceae bacterium]|nr:FAD-dependent monooxygenase [Solirubrobacteraceae bacterium]
MRDGQSYDVAILGGGLAGLTLALQLKRTRPQTSIFVAERRPGEAPLAAFKVGESSVEIAADYFVRLCGLEDHLREKQLIKAGLRFFFPADGNRDITKRVEWGDRAFAPVTTYQLDRGSFENELAERCRALDIDLELGCRVDAVDFGETQHTVAVILRDERRTVTARWVVDGSGRSSFLKRKLDLAETTDHPINSAWLRVGGGLIDLEQWGAHDAEWMARMERPGIRQYSTNHLTGEGYWVWLIPLSSGAHSVGIVADPRLHPFEEISTLDRALDWLSAHEPQVHQAIVERRELIQDFLKVEHFSHGCTRVFHPDRWCITGEAGVFIDPLYSPGSDYICLANTYITELIRLDLGGEDYRTPCEIFNGGFLNLFRTALPRVWGDHYQLFGDAEVFSAKLGYDYVLYWGIRCLVQFHGKTTDPDFNRAMLPHLLHWIELSGNVQQLLRDWHNLAPAENPMGLHVLPSQFPGLWNRLLDMHADLDDATVRSRYVETVGRLEAMAVVLLHKACQRLPPDQRPDPERRIAPLAVSVHRERWEADGLYNDDGLTYAEALERTEGYEHMLLDELVRVGG